VGGSTTVYTGTSLKAPKEVFEKWNVPGVTSEDLEPRYEKYIRENNVHLLPGDEINENNRLFVRGCESLGWHVEQFPINVRGCRGLATCNLGCAVLAKQGTAVVQIPAAESQGVQVISFCRVDRIEDHDVIAEVIPPEFDLQPSTLPAGRYRFRASRIVICAGSIYSPAILFRSLGSNAPAALGRYFTCHPALILAAEHPRPIENTAGHPKSYYCDEFLETDRFLLETCMYFPFTLSKSLCGFGKEVDEMLGHYDRLQMILVLAMDRAEEHNRVLVDSTGNPEVDYTFSRETIRSLVAATRASARIFFEAGAERVHAPGMQKFFLNKQEANSIEQFITVPHFKPGKVSISAAHLMGGCRMGEDLRTSITDGFGRVHGKKDWYVADASLFPAASEVNPYLTIMALADRVAEGIRKDLG
jgi:choline dehydrogenase-like flavoprotein